MHRAHRVLASVIGGVLVLAGLALPALDNTFFGAAPAAAVGEAGFHALTPARIFDTRDGTGTPLSRLGAGATRDIDVTGVGGVPATGASSVVLNVTAVEPTLLSHLTLWPSGIAKPLASNLNFAPQDIVPNLVTVKIGGNGNVSIFNNSGTVDVIADVVGWYDDGTANGDRFAGVTPVRLLDTRDGTGGPLAKFGPGVTRDLDVTGIGGVPATGASAVVLNVTADGGSAVSHATVWPSGITKPVASNLNYGIGQVRPNLVVVKIGGNGNVSIYNNSGSVDMIADVVGWFGPVGTQGLVGGGFEGVTPARILDTRDGTGGPLAKVGAFSTRTLDVTGVGGVPNTNVGAVILNVTADNGSALSYVTVWPADVPRPLASNLNFKANQVTPNLVMVKVSAGGTVNLYNNSGQVDLIADVVGWFTATDPVVVDPNVPPDPATLAPAMPGGKPTDPFNAISFLYTPPNAIQTGVAPGTIQADKAGVFNGTVLKRGGAALPGALVTIVDHPEYGQTYTRADGRWDLVVNTPPAPLTIRVAKVGHLTAQREASVRAGQFTGIDDVVLVALDANVTAVAPNSASMQVAQSTPSTDADGTRTNTLLVPAGTTAQLRMPNGSTQSVGALNIRATEFTVGTDGPAAMPGSLPPTSGFTYAVELSADEAIAAGATSVEFTQPLYNYVDNFLGFTAGSKVPSGWYDRTKNEWVPSENGVVITIVSESGGMANVDLTGDGVADTGTALTDVGFTNAERTKLATLYNPTASLWRVPVTHFTPYDYNWPFGCEGVCEGPSAPAGPTGRGPATPATGPSCPIDGSVIGCQGQTLGERLPIAGTPFSFVYESDRVLGRTDARTISVPVTGATPPLGLRRVEVVIAIAGQTHRFTYDATANRTVEWTWDGKDAYGRVMIDRQQADVDIAYIYGAVYRDPAQFEKSFGTSPINVTTATVTANRSMSEITVADAYHFTMGQRDARSRGMGGWTVDANHQANKANREVELGNGTSRRLPQAQGTIDAIGATANPADNVLTSLPDGSVAYYDFTTNKIRKVNEAGVVADLVGNGAQCPASGDGCGDGGPGSAAQLPFAKVIDLAAAPDGSLYWVESGYDSSVGWQKTTIRKRAPNGTVSRVMGGQCVTAPTVAPLGCGEGLLAADAKLPVAPQIAVSPDGLLWFTHYGVGTVIRRIDADGRVRVVYGRWVGATNADTGPATDVWLNIEDFEFGRDGTMFLSRGSTGIYQISPDGILSRITGEPGACVRSVETGECGFGGPALEADIVRQGDTVDLDVDNDGYVYIGAKNQGTALTDGGRNTIYRFRPGGTLERVAFGRTWGPGKPFYEPCDGDGGAALAAGACGNHTWEVTGDGRIFVFPLPQGGQPTNGIRMIKAGTNTLPAGQVGVPTTDGATLDVFDQATGRHLSSLDAYTNAVLLTFGYDGAGRLTTITDVDANVTTFQRNGAGVLTGVLGPFGHQTTVTMNANGYLSSVSDPSGQLQFGYKNAEGLLSSFTEPGAAVHSFEYDVQGRLTKDIDPEGGFTALARTTIPGGFTVTTTTALGRIATYSATTTDAGVVTHTKTDAAGAVTRNVTPPDGVTSTTTAADGTITKVRAAPDPRWGDDAPRMLDLITTSPAARVSTATNSRVVALADPENLLSHTTITDVATVNGRVTTSLYTTATRTLTVTSPAGVVDTQVLDVKGHIVSTGRAGSDPFTFGHDAKGRVNSVTQGGRTTSTTYDARGRTATETDAKGAVTSYTYDTADRVKTMVRPGGQTRTFGYDVRGNRTSVTMPSGAVHPFTFDDNGLMTSYTAPATTARNIVRDAEGATTSVMWPTGRSVTSGYDAGGRLTGATQPGGGSTFGWTGASQRLATVAGTTPAGTATQTLGYDGEVVTSLDWTGAVAASFDYLYDANGWLVQLAMASGADSATTVVTRNADGAMTAVGPFTFTNAGPGNALSSVSDGTGSLDLVYRSTGEIDDRVLKVGGTTRYRHHVTARDLNGRITGVSEQTGATTDTLVYTYDALGRLATSKRNALPVETYTYDLNGNRTGGGAAGIATFDAADRVTAVAGVTYGHDADGYLTSKGTSTFTYGVKGELRSATVAGTTATYASDGFGRRVTRTVSGQTEQYFYGDPASATRVTAARSAAGVLSLYRYDNDGRLVAIEVGASRFYVGTDHLGTPRVVTDQAGTVVLVRSYDAFGKLTGNTNPAFFLPLGYAGGLDDPLTGLVRMGMRDYLPEAGQFAAVDPLLFEGGFNLYSYVAADPMNAIDPTGLAGVCVGSNFYLGLGVGGEVCVGMDAQGNATMSVCAEAGKGVSSGGGLAFKDPSATSATIFAEGGVTVLGFSAGLGGEIGSYLNECGKWKDVKSPPPGKFSALFASVSSDGTIAAESHNAEKIFGVGIGIKTGGRLCVRIA